MYGQRWRLTRTRKSETVYLKVRAGQNWTVPLQTVSQLRGRELVQLEAGDAEPIAIAIANATSKWGGGGYCN